MTHFLQRHPRIAPRAGRNPGAGGDPAGRLRPVDGGAQRDPQRHRRARVRAGQWIVEQPSDIHRATNRGTTPVVIYLATLLKKGAAPATPVTLP